MPLTLGMLTATAAFDKSLKGIIDSLGLGANLQFCLDAGDINSMPVAVPANPGKWLDTSGNGQDFFLGTTGANAASKPTFNGVPGGLSLNEFFSFDGGDRFTYQAANAAWMQTLHKNNALFTFIAWQAVPLNAAQQPIIRTLDPGNFAPGLWWDTISTGTELILRAWKTSGTSISNVPSTTLGYAINTPFMASVSQDEASATGLILGADNTFQVLNGTYSAPDTANAGTTMSILYGAFTGSKLWMVAAWNRALSQAELTSLYNATKGRFGL